MRLGTRYALFWGQRFRVRLTSVLGKAGFKEEYFLILLSIAIGAATGIFANVFYHLIEAARVLAFGDGDQAGLFAGRVWMLVVLPTVGALAVGCITYYFASEAKGHGVPEVMDAMYRKGGEIRPRVAGAKAIASALTIGSGGSAGTEGPIVQIGAAIGSSLGQYLHIPRRHMGVVAACGVAAGIAAIFNAPIAGVLFALEIFLKDFSFRTFSPIVFSSVISCSTMHALGAAGEAADVAIFEVQALREGGYVFVGAELPLFLLMGVLCSLVAVVFIRTLYATEDATDRLRCPDLVKPAIGALGLGLAAVAYVLLLRPDADPGRMPPFFGNGYPVIESILGHDVFDWGIGALMLLCGIKVVATCLTLGCGGSGGIFAPSLLMGATIGGAFGLALHRIGIIDTTSVGAYALVGMAALVAATTHAPLTAIVMLYEITREPKAILPVMFAAIVATAGAQIMLRDSIYTLKLRRRGVRVGSVADLTILRRITADDLTLQRTPFVHPEDPLQKLIELAGSTDAADFVVVDDHDAYQGMVVRQDIRTALLQPEAVSLLLVGELLRAGVPTVRGDETLDIVLDKFAGNDVAALPKCHPHDPARIEGLITRQAVMRRYHDELDRQTT
ncbi:MAG: chloride channel protein [Phycisphaerae bacterium]